MSGQQLAAAVFFQITVPAPGAVERPELVEHPGGQRGPASRRRGAVKEGTGNALQFLRPPACRFGQVETQPQHRVIQHPGFQVHGGLGQDAADLSAVPHQVVDPLDADFRPAQPFRRPCGRHSGHGGDAHRLPGAEFGPQQNAHIEPAARGRKEGPSAAAPPGGLGLRDEDQTFRRALGGAGTQCGVGAGQSVHHLNLQRGSRAGLQQSPHRAGIEHIGAPPQGITPVGHRVDGIAVRPQRRDGFPYSGPADAKPLSQFLAGQIPPLGTVQRRKDLRFDRHPFTSQPRCAGTACSIIPDISDCQQIPPEKVDNCSKKRDPRAGEPLFWKNNRKYGSMQGENQRWIRPEPSPPASFSTSGTVTML